MEEKCCCADEKVAKLKEIIAEFDDKKGSLITILHEAQEIYGYLPIEVQKIISEETGVPLSEIYGVVTFYSQFYLKPKGEYRISLCMGTTCYVKGAALVLDKIKEVVGAEVGDCTEDGKFSIDACRCIGACGLAPVMMINDDVYGRLVPDEIPGIIEKYKK